jgi:hypothetical protein
MFSLKPRTGLRGPAIAGCLLASLLSNPTGGAQEVLPLTTYVTSGAIVSDPVESAFPPAPPDPPGASDAERAERPTRQAERQTARQNEIDRIYPLFGQKSAGAFAQAHWLLEGDGTALVSLKGTGDIPPAGPE